MQQFLVHVNCAIGASVISSRASFRFLRSRVWAQIFEKCLPRNCVLFATTPAEIVAFWRVVAPLVRSVPSQRRPPAKQKGRGQTGSGAGHEEGRGGEAPRQEARGPGRRQGGEAQAEEEAARPTRNPANKNPADQSAIVTRSQLVIAVTPLKAASQRV